MQNYFSDRPILSVSTPDGYIHECFQLESDSFIVFEKIPGSYPPSSLSITNFKNYIENIKSVSWINDEYNICKCSSLLEEAGFPFDAE